MHGRWWLLTTNSEEIYEISKLYRNHGLVTRDNCKFWGSVTRMDEVQACILNYRLNKLDDLISSRQRNAGIYSIFGPKEYIYPKKGTMQLIPFTHL